MVTPLTATPAWVRAYMEAVAAGTPDAEAAATATRLFGPKGKEFAHCRIRTRTLTVPVAGGGAALKRRGADPVISEHGKWRREHLGAWLAAYGRTPYYEHLMPAIARVYECPEGTRLEDFNSAMLRVALDWLDPAALAPLAPRLEAVRADAQAKTDASLSIFDVIFRLGREAVFAL